MSAHRRLLRTVVAVLAALTVAVVEAPPALARAPLGYQLMCLKNPRECKGGGTSTQSISTDEMKILNRINASVNRSIQPRHDSAGTDVWTVNATSGDCEEYALAKRRALIKAGFSPSALRLAYVKTRSGEAHAVLIVHSTKGDLVLDNLTSKIRPLSQSGLRLITMAGANPTQWS
jgi:predicted transglutaminase-like cysteine proteinase